MATSKVYVEMRWLCPDKMCAQENLGRDKTCCGCGRPKGENVHDYFHDDKPDDAPEVTDKNLLIAASGGVDRVCAWCNAVQFRVSKNCQHCGGSMSKSKKDAQQELHKAAPSYDLDAVDVEMFKPRLTVLKRAASISAVIATILAIITLACYAFQSKDVPVTVTHVAWIHAAQVEQHIVQHRESFDENKPHDAFNVTVIDPHRWHHNEKVIDHYEKVDHPYDEKVFDHYERVNHPQTKRVSDGTETYSCTKTVNGPDKCQKKNCRSQKNGFAACDNVCTPTRKTVSDTCTREKYKTVTVDDYRNEPVYRIERRHKYTDEPVYRMEPRTEPWYAWDIWVWVHIPEHDAATSGLSTDDISDPHVELKENERVLRVNRSYDVVVVDVDGKQTTVHPKTQEEFVKFPIGSKHIMRVSLVDITMDPPNRR